MKHKFKIGDKVVISKFPMGMNSGDSNSIRTFYESHKVFTIESWHDGLQLHLNQTRIPCFFAKESDGWYFDLDSVCLAKGYKRPRQPRGWTLA